MPANLQPQQLEFTADGAAMPSLNKPIKPIKTDLTLGEEGGGTTNSTTPPITEEGTNLPPAKPEKDKYEYDSSKSGSGLDAASEDSKYIWDKQAEEQAGLKLGIDHENARLAAMDSARNLETNRQSSALNSALGKYTTAQQVDKYGWNNGGSEYDMEYQLNYMKASIAADLYNLNELQKMGLESNLSVARMNYSLNKNQLALEAYDKERAYALSEGDRTGVILTAEARDQLKHNQAATMTLTKYDENNLPEEGTQERIEYDRAKRVLAATDAWFETNGISKSGQQTLSAWQAEWDKYYKDHANYVDEIVRNNNTLSQVAGMNEEYKDALHIAVPGKAGLEMKNIKDLSSDEVKAYFGNEDGTLNTSKLFDALDSREMSPEKYADILKKVGYTGEYDGFNYKGDSATFSKTNLADYSKFVASLGDFGALDKYGDKAKEYTYEGKTYEYNKDSKAWQIKGMNSDGSSSASSANNLSSYKSKKEVLDALGGQLVRENLNIWTNSNTYSDHNTMPLGWDPDKAALGKFIASDGKDMKVKAKDYSGGEQPANGYSLDELLKLDVEDDKSGKHQGMGKDANSLKQLDALAKEGKVPDYSSFKLRRNSDQSYDGITVGYKNGRWFLLE